MESIKQLKKHIRGEIKDAEEYIREALACKDECRERADLYRELAEEELRHMDKLHAEVVREIKKYRDETGHEPPPDMQARYDVLHRIAVEDANDVKMLIRLYKEG